MTIASDHSRRHGSETPEAMLPPQRLGFLPTREFWQDDEYERQGCLLYAIPTVILMVSISMLDPPWWASVVLFIAVMVLMKGLSERYVRHNIQRRVRSRPERETLPEGDDTPDE